MPPQPRVLSLLSASTEIVHRLGCAHLLVGRSHGCDDPPLATVLPITTAPRVDPNAPSLELDKAVRAQADSGGPIYHINSDFVRTLQPDVIITQEQCRICAVTPEDVESVCTALPNTKLVTIKPTTLDDVLDDVVTIARALGVSERGAQLVRMLRSRLESLTPLTVGTSSRPKVVHLEWLAPLMGSGYWIAECMEAAGCEMVHGCRGGHSPTIERISLLADADVILIAPCGFSIERTHAELEALGLLQADEWRALPAVQQGRVAIADGNLYFNRSSCGVLESAEIVAEVAHDELQGLFGHHGCRWVRLSELSAFCTRDGAPPPTKHVVLAPSSSEDGAVRQTATPVKLAVGVAEACKPSQHVATQLQALREGDFVHAFALNSSSNRARLGDAATFEKIVKNSSSFCTLTDPATGCEICSDMQEAATAACHGSKAAVRVSANPADHTAAVEFVFDLSCGESGSWETDGVRIEC